MTRGGVDLQFHRRLALEGAAGPVDHPEGEDAAILGEGRAIRKPANDQRPFPFHRDVSAAPHRAWWRPRESGALVPVHGGIAQQALGFGAVFVGVGGDHGDGIADISTG